MHNLSILKTTISITVLIAIVICPGCSSSNTTINQLKPFGILNCKTIGLVRFCPGGIQKNKDLRIPSFDGTLIDTDITLPKSGNGPWPLIVMIPGLGQDKHFYEGSFFNTPTGFFNNVGLAEEGFAVLNYTPRGFGESCGPGYDSSPACLHGFFDLADQAYEIRDVQYLAGLLVDENIALPSIGVTGISYGGGQTLELALLYNRIRLPNGSFAKWLSPRKHIPCHIGAAVAFWAWYNLVNALTPEGAYTPNGNDPARSSNSTDFGVPKESYIKLLGAIANSAHIAPKAQFPEFYNPSWENIALSGDVTNPEDKKIAYLIRQFHSPAGIPLRQGPAPIFIANGITDPLFPASEAIELQNRVLEHNPKAVVDLYLGDVGHPWSNDVPATFNLDIKKGEQFLVNYLKHKTPEKTTTVVSSFSCPAPQNPLFTVTGTTFKSIKTLNLTQTLTINQTVNSNYLNPDTSNKLDDASGFGAVCKAIPITKNVNGAVSVNISLPSIPPGSTFVVFGSPTISFKASVNAKYFEIVARLWDVNTTTNTRQLITRSPAWFKNSSTTYNMGLFETCYPVSNQDNLELQLIGQDPPSFSPLKNPFQVDITQLNINIPYLALG